MHFIAYEFAEDELPFEDYSLKCKVRIEEEAGSVLEKELIFEFSSSIEKGRR